MERPIPTRPQFFAVHLLAEWPMVSAENNLGFCSFHYVTVNRQMSWLVCLEIAQFILDVFSRPSANFRLAFSDSPNQDTSRDCVPPSPRYRLRSLLTIDRLFFRAPGSFIWITDLSGARDDQYLNFANAESFIKSSRDYSYGTFGR